MKKYVTVVTSLLLLLVLSFSGLHSEVITYSNNWGRTGINLENQNATGVEVIFSIEQFILEEQLVNGEMLSVLQVPGIFLPNDEGAPNLPGTGRYIALPQGARATFQITAYRTEKYENIEIAPAPRIPWETEDGPLYYEKNTAIYQQDDFYPESAVKLSEKTQIRGVDAVLLGVTPFQYNPVSKELLIYKDLRIKVNFEGGNGHFGEDRLRSRWWDPLLRDIFVNEQMLPQMNYQYNTNESRDPGCEYLVICPDDPVFLSWADSIRVFRTRQGILTDVMTTTEVGGNTTTAIENFVNSIMDPVTGWNPAPAAILLLGDYGTSGNTIVSPIWNSYCVSDNIYADVNGNSMPDVVFARMTAQNATHLETMITKFLDYERTPPTNPNYYNNPITALGWQTERWFQICSEVVGGFWNQVMGKSTVRVNEIYSGTPSTTWSTATNTSTVLNFFGPNGLNYIPATPNVLGGWSGGNATDINNAINSGAFMLQHRDHGYEQGWGEPAYSSSHINGLTNTDLVFVFSINCLTGKYNLGSECFAEKFHRYTYNGQNSGALGITAASEVSYSFVNDTYVWGLFDNLWPNFMPSYGTTPPSRDVLPAFGNAAGKYFLQQSSWPYNTSNKEVTYNLFHHHGDAFTTVYTEMPQSLTVNHNAVLFGGQSSFTVTADQGGLIALTVNDEIIGVEVGTGIPVNIQIPPQVPGDQMMVTVTKQNYYRYEQPVMITAASGPYLYCMNAVTVDTTGNSNGIPECGEIVELKLNLTNLGVENATNITATINCPDTMISIMNGGVTSISVVNVGDTLVEGSFGVQINSQAPHLHLCQIDLQMQADSAGVPAGYQWNQVVPLVIRQGSQIELSDQQLSFPQTFLNFTSTLPLTFQNTGADTLLISDITADLPQYDISVSSLVINPGESQQVEVSFTPDDTLIYNATFTVLNNDPVNYETSFTVLGEGVNAPDVQTVPEDTFTITVGVTDSVTQDVTIQNVGLGELVFNVQIAGWDPENGEGAGGSDTYGHMWIDSDEPNGPTFDWIDISQTGTQVQLTGNNSISSKITIGFPFSFYGQSYSDLRVCTNGWLSFTTFSVAYNNYPLPSNLAPRAMIAPLWDDLNFQPDSRLYYENQGNKLVLMYEDVYRITGEGPYTFEVILFDNDNIVIQYLDLQNLVDDYTVGIQNHVADDGLTIAHNESYLHNNLAILISRATWVSVSPLSGVIPAQSSSDVSLTFITSNFPEGDFWASLQIESNDPDEGIYLLPIHMIVSATTSFEDMAAEIPREFKLFQNTPNPFNPITIINYHLPQSSQVDLVIFNMLGQRIKTLVSERQEARQYQIRWDGSNDQGARVASGIYIYQLRTENNIATKKMILMK
ncbi:MAG: T9SS type A sorting domain-containing protein [bacterium]|nr:MAG: T9SS type A sorting domain-containing protein [bacterium]